MCRHWTKLDLICGDSPDRSFFFAMTADYEKLKHKASEVVVERISAWKLNTLQGATLEGSSLSEEIAREKTLMHNDVEGKIHVEVWMYVGSMFLISVFLWFTSTILSLKGIFLPKSRKGMWGEMYSPFCYITLLRVLGLLKSHIYSKKWLIALKYSHPIDSLHKYPGLMSWLYKYFKPAGNKQTITPWQECDI